MENIKVLDLMVPVDKFPRISGESTLYEALSALEIAQEAFLSGKAEQRILLVENEQKRVIGKISPIDLFFGLEKNYNKVNFEDTVNKFGLSYIYSKMKKDYNLWESPFKDLCHKAGSVLVKDFVNIPAKDQSVKAEDSLGKCFHLFAMNRNDSIFVFKGDAIIGVLRFSDVYRKVSQTMKACGL